MALRFCVHISENCCIYIFLENNSHNFFCVLKLANGQCGQTSDWDISQSQTGTQVQNKPEWKVTITNNCLCTRTDLKLNCVGFQTTEEVDPSIVAVNGGNCLINKVFHSQDSVSFTYAWDNQFPFLPIDASLACS